MKLLRFESHKIMFFGFKGKEPIFEPKKKCITNGLISKSVQLLCCRVLLPLSAAPPAFFPPRIANLPFLPTRHWCRQLANRVADDAIAVKRIAEIEREAGQAVLRAITSYSS